MLTADEASDIARDAGLTVQDAVAIRALTGDPAEAQRIAAKFARGDEATVVAALFGEDDERIDFAEGPTEKVAARLFNT